MNVGSPTLRWSVYTLDELCDAQAVESDCVIGEGLLPRGGRILMYAPGGTGKTTLVLHLAACLAHGQPFLGRFAVDRPYRVLVVQCELTEGQLKAHAPVIRAAYEATENLVFIRTWSLRLPRDGADLDTAIAWLQPDILILDSFRKTFGGESSNDQDQVGRYLDELDRLIEQHDLAGVVLVHNSGWSGEARGSTVFRDWPDTKIKLSRGSRKRERKLTVEKIRTPGYDTEGQTFVLAFDAQGRYEVVGGATGDATPVTTGRARHDPSWLLGRVEDVLRENGGQMPAGELARKLHVAPAIRDGLVATLADRGIVRRRNVRPGRKGGRPTTVVELVEGRATLAA